MYVASEVAGSGICPEILQNNRQVNTPKICSSRNWSKNVFSVELGFAGFDTYLRTRSIPNNASVEPTLAVLTVRCVDTRAM